MINIHKTPSDGNPIHEAAHINPVPAQAADSPDRAIDFGASAGQATPATGSSIPNAEAPQAETAVAQPSAHVADVPSEPAAIPPGPRDILHVSASVGIGLGFKGIDSPIEGDEDPFEVEEDVAVFFPPLMRAHRQSPPATSEATQPSIAQGAAVPTASCKQSGAASSPVAVNPLKGTSCSTGNLSAYVSPLERPEPIDSGSAVPSDSPNLLDYLSKKYPCFSKHLEDLPKPGSGETNRRLYFAALAGLAQGLIPEEVNGKLYAAAEKKGHPLSDLYQKVWHAIECAARHLSGSTTTDIEKSLSRRPKADWALIEKIVLAHGKLSDLKNASNPLPVSYCDSLDLWFRPGELACLAEDKSNFATRRVEEWKDLRLPCQLFIPNPMSRKYGRTRCGHVSERTIENVGPRRILPIEFDFCAKQGPECESMLKSTLAQNYSVHDVNAALHIHLDSILPLGAAVHSGGKSIHGHYPCAHLSDGDLQQFKEYATVLGGDTQVFIANQLVRFPGGRRSDNGNEQTLLYVNLEVMGHE